ncbi:hypothetical protein ILYODFUR_028966 [Ilyodon furcidens]|uniref:Uncharacterized protein n=1 Tax=Ilyodon furcidens TaxID=33524 RepID=A0ABV0SQV7_9TELE
MGGCLPVNIRRSMPWESPKGYEHFYDAEKCTGYVSWRLKTIFRNAVKRPAKMATVAQAQGPKRRRW